MASLSFLVLLCFLPFSLSSTHTLPLTKSPPSRHYLTRIHLGSKSNPQPVDLIIDLNSPILWLDCSSTTPNPTPVNCRSIECTSAIPDPCPSSNTQFCSLPLHNPSSGATSNGHLVQGSISFPFQNSQISTIESFLLSCSPSNLLSGLPSNTKGVLGLGPTRIGPVSQISHLFEQPKKFSICLSPSKNGVISFGDDKREVFKSMTYTPLLSFKEDPSYNIHLKSLKIQNKRVPIDELTSIKVSTVDPYSKMDSRVFQEFAQAFATEAEAVNPNLVRVPPQGGFEVCYGVDKFTVTPVIDLVLQSEMVKWRIYGHNSMVRMNDGVICLGFLDGGEELKEGSIVLGAHQLEDNLLDFDLGSSMLGFSSSLIKMKTSCSELAVQHQQQSVQSS